MTSVPITPGQHDWTGLLQTSPLGLRLVLRAPLGFNRPVTLYSIDQSPRGFAGQSQITDAGDVRIRFADINGAFVGALQGETITGVWTQSGRDRPLIFRKGAAGLKPLPPPALTQDRLEALRAAAQSPALIAGAQRQNRPVWIAATGRRSAAAETAVTTDDQWHIGSITKSMTALLAARLVEQGAVSWDDTVGGVLGAQIPNMEAGYRDATFVNLFQHRACLESDPDPLAFVRFHANREPMPTQRLDYCRMMLAKPARGERGVRFGYSNAGYVVAGAMLEARTGKPWEQLMRDLVFAPLGMEGAGFGPPDPATQPLGHTKGLFGNRRAPQDPRKVWADNPAVMGPAGTVHARVADMLAYLAAHRDRPADLLSRAGWDRLHTPPKEGTYAMGWETRDGGLMSHDGSNTMWLASAYVQPTVVAFAATNDGHLSQSEEAVLGAVLGAAAAV